LLSRKFIQTRRVNSKLDFRHLGPFKVLAMVGTNTVWLDISTHYPLLYPVFNVSLLTPYKDPATNHFCTQEITHQNHLVPPAQVDWTLLDSVLDHRSKQKGSDDYLLRWKFSTPASDQWFSWVEIPWSLHGLLVDFHHCTKTPIPLLLVGRR
jgi:hypothetical protein